MTLTSPSHDDTANVFVDVVEGRYAGSLRITVEELRDLLPVKPVIHTKEPSITTYVQTRAGSHDQVRLVCHCKMRIIGVEGQLRREDRGLQRSHRPIPSAVVCYEGQYRTEKWSHTLTCNVCLRTGLVDDILVALLSPNLVVVFHTSRLVRLRLLMSW